MRRVVLGAGSLLALLLPSAIRAQQTEAPRTPAARVAPLAEALSGQRADVPPQGSSGNRWRYTFHNGHWWYYRDGGRWAYWTGTKWLDFEPKSYGRWYVNRKMADYDAEVARFDARLMRPYMSPSFTDGYSGWNTLNYRSPMTSATSPWARSGGISSGLFTPRGFDGRLNPATSIGGYMGGALRGPFGY